MSDPRPSAYTWNGRKWRGPTWAGAISDDLIFEIIPSKTERTTGKRVRADRDFRAGAITEASMGGASADDRAKQAGHSVKINRKAYDRDVLESARRVAEARKKFREGQE
jgi:hypothetical protein